MSIEIPPEDQLVVNKYEYVALIELDKMVRLAMGVPNTAEFLVSAMHAVDAIRREYGMEIPPVPRQPEHMTASRVSGLAQGLIRRATEH